MLLAATVSANQTIDWHRGNSIRKAAFKEVNGRWVDAPLRSMLTQLSQSKKIPLFIDRRVDPSVPVSLTTNGKNWEQLLTELGADHGYGFCRLEGIYYFGPLQTAIALPVQYKKLKGWVIKHRKESELNWRKSTPMRWQNLSQPREIFEQLANENGVELHEFDIPFDLWPEAELPNVPLLLKAALISAAFDQWILISRTGAKLKLVDFPQPANVEYRLMEIANPKRAMSGFVGNVKTRIDGNSFVISGTIDQVAKAVAFAIKSQKVVRNKQNSASVYTAELRDARGVILATIAQQMAVRLTYDRSDAGLLNLLNEQIEFKVVDADSEEFIDSALAGTGLRHRIGNGVLEIFR